MSKTKIIGCLALAGVTVVLGGVMEDRIGFPSSILLGITMFSVMLLTYPAAKWWDAADRNISFKKWVLGSLVASSTATAIIVAISLL